jgi:GTP1/Obg family GTP-binding protein
MKPVFIRFTDDEGKEIGKYTSSCSMKTGMMDRIFAVAERAEKLDSKDTSMTDVREFYDDLKDVIVEVFKYKFNIEELNESVEQDELMKTFMKLCGNIGGEMRKN